jgi:hypothetical protein
MYINLISIINGQVSWLSTLEMKAFKKLILIFVKKILKYSYSSIIN